MILSVIYRKMFSEEDILTYSSLEADCLWKLTSGWSFDQLLLKDRRLGPDSVVYDLSRILKLISSWIYFDISTVVKLVKL